VQGRKNVRNFTPEGGRQLIIIQKKEEGGRDSRLRRYPGVGIYKI